MNDGESDKKFNTIQDGNNMFNASHIFLPIWLRRFIQEDNGLDGFILEYCYNFLLPFGSILWIIYLFT